MMFQFETTVYDRTLASGIFKFSNHILPQALVDFAREHWMDEPNFLELSVRGCDGERKFGIAFKCRHSGDKKEFERFTDQCAGRLMRVFGKDFLGWDLSSSTYLIK